MTHFLYFSLMVASILGPLSRSFESRIGFFWRWRAYASAIFFPAVVFIIWDEFFVRLGVWGFNSYYVTGPKIGHLPVEEILFFFAVPYACLFIYESVKLHLKRSLPNGIWRILTLVISLVFFSAAWQLRHQLYPCVTFSSAAALGLGLTIWPPACLGYFWIAYLFSLIPCVIVDAILTGSLTQNPIVWYNPQEMLGIRFLSIPIEDFAYLMVLVFANFTIYEWLQARGQTRIDQPQ